MSIQQVVSPKLLQDISFVLQHVTLPLKTSDWKAGGEHGIPNPAATEQQLSRAAPGALARSIFWVTTTLKQKLDEMHVYTEQTHPSRKAEGELEEKAMTSRGQRLEM